MFEFTESVRVEAPPDEVWKLLADVERWWLSSNKDHIRLEAGSSDELGVGTEVAFEERVAGIKGRAKGIITRWVPGDEATWEGEAKYRYMGFSFRVQEGVSWRVESDGEATRLSARVWAKFPSGIFGRISEWYSKSLLQVVDRDREHARRELEYLKRSVEKTIDMNTDQ